MNRTGKSVAVVGGDRRMQEAVQCLLQSGVDVRIAALSRLGGGVLPQFCATAAEALDGATILVLPVQGVSEQGMVQVQPGVPECRVEGRDLERMGPGALVFTGIANGYLRRICGEAGLPLVEYREADEFAIWNSIPSAEGAIQMAMEDSPFTIFGSRSLVLGFGRTGKALALLLRGLYSDPSVIARNPLDQARIWAAGYRYRPWSELSEAAAESEFIFNTVPAPVLTRQVMCSAHPRTVIIDVASAPGGTDFGAAKDLGISARLAPGLPGIVAPATAGRILAGMVLRHLNDSSEGEVGAHG